MGGTIFDPIDGPLGFIAEVTGLTSLLKVFGVETHNETFTDLQISNLLTPGEADKAARRSAKHASKGSSAIYFKGYKGFQRDYRKKYSAQFMQRQGYAPNSTATAVIATMAKTKAYLELLYGYANVSVQSFGDRYLTLLEKSRHAVQQIVGYEFATGQIVISGKIYNNHQYLELVDDTKLQVTSTRLYNETIVQNLTDNYAYDGTKIYVGIDVYIVGAISDTVNGNDEYETICVHTLGTLPDKIVLTPVERIVNVVTQAAYGTEASYASYRVLSGEVGTETRYWVDVANTKNIYDTTILAVTAIIPMKENNVMTDTSAYKLTRMLRKLNLSGDQLKSSIENPDMDSAYLMMGINPEYNDDITNEVMFRLFDYLSPGSGSMNISISQLSMTYRFTMAKSTILGSIGPRGTYTRAQSGSGGGVVMTLRFQGDANEYQQLVISGFEQNCTISGHGFTAYLDSTGGYCRIAIPLTLLNSLPYKKFVWIYERSLCMLAYSMQVVEVKWYETAAFGTLLKIVGVVLLVWGVGSAVMAAANMAGTAMTMAGQLALGSLVSGLGLSTVAAVAAANVAVVLLEAAIIGLVVSEALSMLADYGVGGAVLAAIATLAAYTYGVNGASTSYTSQQWLMMANNALSTYTQYISNQTQNIMGAMEEFKDTMLDKISDLEDKIEESKNDINSTFASAMGVPNELFNSIEKMVNDMVQTDVETLVDYGKQMEYAIESRTTVWVGP